MLLFLIKYYIYIINIEPVSTLVFIFLVSSVIGGNHTIYVSNSSSSSSENGTVVYSSETLPTDIIETTVFRYLTFEARFQEPNILIEICEIGIVGEWLNIKTVFTYLHTQTKNIGVRRFRRIEMIKKYLDIGYPWQKFSICEKIYTKTSGSALIVVVHLKVLVKP